MIREDLAVWVWWEGGEDRLPGSSPPTRASWIDLGGSPTAIVRHELETRGIDKKGGLCAGIRQPVTHVPDSHFTCVSPVCESVGSYDLSRYFD